MSVDKRKKRREGEREGEREGREREREREKGNVGQAVNADATVGRMRPN